MVFTIVLKDGPPWGFRLQGGADFHEPIRIAKINPNSKAYNEGVSVGDYVESINGRGAEGLLHSDAQQLIKEAVGSLSLELSRGTKTVNGTVNGDVQHIGSVSDDQLYAGDSDTSYRSYQPVSFSSRSRDYTSPSQESQSSMTITVNSRKDTSSFTRPETNGLPVTSPAFNGIQSDKKHEPNRSTLTVTTTKPGVWSPGTQIQPLVSKSYNKPEEPKDEPSLKDIAPVWTPGGSTTTTIKKEFKPVRLDTSVKPEKPKPTIVQHEPKAEESYAWTPKRSGDSDAAPTSAFVYTPPPSKTLSPPPATTTTVKPATSSTDFSSMNGDGPTMDSLRDEPSRLPPTQSPYITLLQKSRDGEPPQGLNIVGSPITVTEEGQIPRGAIYLGKNETVEGDVKHTDEYYAVPQEGEETKSTKVVEQKPKIYAGIGPLDDQGVPLAFRKNIDESKQSDWYKQMFKSLHVGEKKDGTDQNTYRPTYRFPAEDDHKSVEEEVNPYKPSYEILSPKERASSLEKERPGPRERATFGKDYRRNSTSMCESDWIPADARARKETYKIQPRSIMDYEPGFSSIAFREAKTGVVHNPPIDKPGQFSQYSVGHARADTRPVTDNEFGPDTSGTYKYIQKGGEIPYRGLQKPAPDKPVGKCITSPLPPTTVFILEHTDEEREATQCFNTASSTG